MMRRRAMTTALVALWSLGAFAPAAWADADDLRDSLRTALGAWNMPAAEVAAVKLRAIAPNEHETLQLVGHLHLMQGRYHEAAQALEQAVRLGAGGMAAHYLELARNTYEETKGYVKHTTRGGHFVISHAPGPDEILVPYAEEALEGAWTELTQVFQWTPPEAVRVEFYPRVDVLGAVSSLTVDEIKTSGTIALCKYNRLMVVSPRDLVYGYDWTDTIAHEFIHLLITQKSGNNVPIWLHEGLAKYYESRWKGGSKPALSRVSEDLLAKAVEGDTLISFEAMSPSMAKLPSQEATSTAFAEVFMVVEFLVSRGGDAIAAELVRLMGEGKSDRDSVAAVAGVSWSRFTPAWKEYLKRRGLRTLVDVFPMRLLFRGPNSSAEELQALKGDKARRFTWLGDQLRLRERYKAAAKEYRKGADQVGNKTPIIQSKLGFALLRMGQLDEAIAALKEPLAAYPDYVLLHLYLGEALLEKGNLAAAVSHLEAATHLNPFDPDLHKHLAQAYQGLGQLEKAKRERGLHRLINRR